MDDKVSYTYPILLMIIIAPRHAPKGGASVVIGACFCAPPWVSEELLAWICGSRNPVVPRKF